MVSLSAEISRTPYSVELEALFEIVTRTLEEKMILAAEIEISEPAMEADELEELIARDIADARATERQLAEKAGGIVTQSDLDAIEVGVANDLRKRFSGKRRLRRKEWYSTFGALYRSDWFDYMVLDSYPSLQEKIVSGEIPTHLSEISFADSGLVADPRFPEGRGISIDHGIQSASVYKEGGGEVDEPELWPVLTLEGELAFPLGVLLAKEGSIPEDPTFRDMMVGARLDEDKLDQAIRGKVLGWKIVAENKTLDGQAVTKISMRGQPKSMFNQILRALVEKTSNVEIKEDLADAASAEYSYWIAAIGSPNGARLLRAEKRVPGKFLVSSTREWDKSTGLIGRWVKLRRDLKTGEETQLSYSFDEMDLNAAFSDDEVFGYGQLADFEFINYDNRLVQFPEGTKIIESGTSSNGSSDWVRKVILFTIVLIPVLFIRKVLGLSKPISST